MTRRRSDFAEASTTGADQPTVTPISDGNFTIMGNTNCCYSKFARPSDQRGEKKRKRRKHNRVDVGSTGSDAKVITSLPQRQS